MSSMGVNKVILIGNAGQDAQVRSTSAGKTVANFSLAINQPFRDKKGENAQRVEWVRCVAWAKRAGIARKFVTAGRLIFVEGYLQTRQFEDRDGVRRTVTEVVVSSLRVLGGAKKAGGGNSQNSVTSATEDAKSKGVPF